MSASRRDRIRTCDPCVPNTVLYQAEPHAALLRIILVFPFSCKQNFYFFLLISLRNSDHKHFRVVFNNLELTDTRVLNKTQAKIMHIHYLLGNRKSKA